VSDARANKMRKLYQYHKTKSYGTLSHSVTQSHSHTVTQSLTHTHTHTHTHIVSPTLTLIHDTLFPGQAMVATVKFLS
jgi:hypothetical protein